MLGYGKTGVSVMVLSFPYFRGVFYPKKIYICTLIEKGDLSEWFKEHAWKVCILQKGIKSSNLLVSAKLKKGYWLHNQYLFH